MDPPKPLKNDAYACFLNVGFQSLASLETLKKLYNDGNYQTSDTKEAMHRVLYDKDTHDVEGFVNVWNEHVQTLIDALPPEEEDPPKEDGDDDAPPEAAPQEEEQEKDKDNKGEDQEGGEEEKEDKDNKEEVEQLTHRERLLRLMLNTNKPNKPLLFLQDIFPMIWPREIYPWYIQGLEFEEIDNVSKNFETELETDIASDHVDNEDDTPFKKVMVILLEGAYTKEMAKEKAENSAKRRKSEFNKIITIKKASTEEGKQLRFGLVAVVDFSPLEEGHYIAYVKRRAPDNSEVWYEANDKDVNIVPYEEVKKIMLPELLIYELEPRLRN